MIGYIIYHRLEAQKNQGFIQMFQKEGKQYHIEFRLVCYEEYEKEKLPDFVINRTRDPKVSRWFQNRNVKVFHTEEITLLGNHKGKTIEYLQKIFSKKEKKWCPLSFYYPKEKAKEDWEKMENKKVDQTLSIYSWLLQKEFVVKTVDGHGGSEVALIQGNGKTVLEALQDTEYAQWYREQWKRFQEKDCLIQEKIPSNSQDVRVYVVGNRIYHAMVRQGTKDFRSNFSLGGSACSYQLTLEERLWVNEFIKAFSKAGTLAMVGIDFILSNQGELIFNELEEMVGSRMLYANTSLDIVKDYVACLAEELLKEV